MDENLVKGFNLQVFKWMLFRIKIIHPDNILRKGQKMTCKPQNPTFPKFLKYYTH